MAHTPFCADPEYLTLVLPRGGTQLVIPTPVANVVVQTAVTWAPGEYWVTGIGASNIRITITTSSGLVRFMSSPSALHFVLCEPAKQVDVQSPIANTEIVFWRQSDIPDRLPNRGCEPRP